MAKSFFTQILDLAGISLPDPNTQHDDPSKYRLSTTESQAQSASGLTRVEQYLQKKNPPAKKMTRVEQYLAKKQAAMESEQKAQTPETTVVSDDSQLTGVARYLARKQASQQTVTTQKEPAASKPKTRVEKYLAQKQNQLKQTSKKNSTDKPAASVKKTEPGASASATGVDKYLSRKKSAPVSAPSKEIVETAKPEEKPPVEVTKAKKPAVATESKEEKSSTEKPKEQIAQSTTATRKSTSIIDHAANADQCQAATQKGTRCRRKSNLEILTKTINKQKYRFAVCHQHNNSDFVPFEEFVQST